MADPVNNIDYNPNLLPVQRSRFGKNLEDIQGIAVGQSNISRPEAGKTEPLIINGRKIGTIKWGTDSRYHGKYNWNNVKIIVFPNGEDNKIRQATLNNDFEPDIGATKIIIEDTNLRGINIDEIGKKYLQELQTRAGFLGERLPHVTVDSHGGAERDPDTGRWIYSHANLLLGNNKVDLHKSFDGKRDEDTIDPAQYAASITFTACAVLGNQENKKSSQLFFKGTQEYVDKNNIIIQFNTTASYGDLNIDKSSTGGPRGKPKLFRPFMPPSDIPQPDFDYAYYPKDYKLPLNNEVPTSDFEEYEESIKRRLGIPGSEPLEADLSRRCMQETTEKETIRICNFDYSDYLKGYYHYRMHERINMPDANPVDWGLSLSNGTLLDSTETLDKFKNAANPNAPPGRVNVGPKIKINERDYINSGTETQIWFVNPATKQEALIPVSIYYKNNKPELGKFIINTETKYMAWEVSAKEADLILIDQHSSSENKKQIAQRK